MSGESPVEFVYDPGALPLQMRDELAFIGMAVRILLNMDVDSRQRVLDYLSSLVLRDIQVLPTP